jgi:hypothetical protein
VCYTFVSDNRRGGIEKKKKKLGSDLDAALMKNTIAVGSDVFIFKIFSPKNVAKILAFFAQTAATFCKHLIITLVFEKNANFFTENWQKMLKILIITLTPGADPMTSEFTSTTPAV